MSHRRGRLMDYYDDYYDNPYDDVRSNPDAADFGTPNGLAKTALVADEAVRRYRIPITDRFYEYANDPVTLRRARQLAGYTGYSGEKAPSFIVLEYQLLRWVQFGLSTVRLTEDLAAALALTDVRDVPFDAWKWPFPAFLIHVPYDFWTINTTYGPDRATMILVSKMTSRDGAPMAQQMMFSRQGAMTFSKVPLYGAATIGEWLDDVAEINRNQTSISDTFELYESDQRNMNEGWKLVVNTCLYITERGRGEHVVGHTSKGARKRAAKKGGALPRGPEVWILGKEIKLDREVIAAAKSHAVGGPGWRVKARSITRGHWRNVAYGPGYSLHREKFIEPYYRGPKEGERLAHLYTSDSDDE